MNGILRMTLIASTNTASGLQGFMDYMSYVLNSGDYEILRAVLTCDALIMIIVAVMTSAMLLGIMITKDERNIGKYYNWIKQIWIAWFVISFVNLFFSALIEMAI